MLLQLIVEFICRRHLERERVREIGRADRERQRRERFQRVQDRLDREALRESLLADINHPVTTDDDVDRAASALYELDRPVSDQVKVERRRWLLSLRMRRHDG